MGFKEDIKKVSSPRRHIIHNSYGVYDAYKYYRKTRNKDKQYVLTDSLYYSIIRTINNLLIDKLLNESELKFPKRMGKLIIQKNTSKIYMLNGKLINTYPIDWESTLKLWEEDKDSYKEKIKVKYVNKETFKIVYDKRKANYVNKSFYDFKPNRKIKVKMKEYIQDNKLEAYIKT